ncbi:MAG: type II secretion system F family protein [Phycisphaeraceae bacterium]
MMLVGALTAGLLFGAGVTAIAWGLRPPLPRLDRQVAAVLGGPAATAATGWQRWREQLAAGTPTTVMPDLVLLGRTAEDLVVSRLMWATAGLVTATVVAGFGDVPGPLLPGAAAAGAAAGWMTAVHRLREQATGRRRTLGLALAAWTQMAALMIRAGITDEQAMRRAATAGDHWSFRMLSAAMDRALANQSELWAGLDDLGHETDVPEIRQLAAELRLTETAGGSPADGLLARAEALRQDELANQLSAAKAAKLKQDIVLAGLGIILVLYVIYPTVRTLLDSQM